MTSYSMRENKNNHCVTLKNITFKNTYIGKLKKIPLAKNIVMGGFLPTCIDSTSGKSVC